MILREHRSEERTHYVFGVQGFSIETTEGSFVGECSIYYLVPLAPKAPSVPSALRSQSLHCVRKYHNANTNIKIHIR
jgi:hypothetical protein